MKTITITGGSDDLVEVEGCKGADEFTYPSKGPWRGDLIAPDGGQLRVHVMYDGCWHVSAGQVDDGVLLPDWPISFRQGSSYAVEMVVEAPDGTRLTNTGEAEIQ